MSRPELPNDHRGRVLLYHGRGWVSRAVRWQTWGPYSHAAILMPCHEWLVESWWQGGVQHVPIRDWSGVDCYDVPSMTVFDWSVASDYAMRQVGCGYDFAGILRFIRRGRGCPDSRWFCSELVYAALAQAGTELFARIEPWQVSPSMLSYSPRIVPDIVPPK